MSHAKYSDWWGDIKQAIRNKQEMTTWHKQMRAADSFLVGSLKVHCTRERSVKKHRHPVPVQPPTPSAALAVDGISRPLWIAFSWRHRHLQEPGSQWQVPAPDPSPLLARPPALAPLAAWRLALLALWDKRGPFAIPSSIDAPPRAKTNDNTPFLLQRGRETRKLRRILESVGWQQAYRP